MFDGIKADRRNTGTSTGLACQTEAVVEDRTVERDVVQTVVLTTERSTVRLRGKTREVVDGATQCRKRAKRLRAYVRTCTCTVTAKQVVAVGRYFYAGNLHSGGTHREVERRRCTQAQIDVFERLVFITCVRNYDAVRTTYAHTRYAITAVNIGSITIDRTRRQVCGNDVCTDERFFGRSISDLPCHCRGGNTLSEHEAREQYQRNG